MADTANDYTFSPPPSFFKPFMEPASKAAPVAPYNTITATRSGHSFEMDDTPSVERIRLNHRSGTFIEMGPDGDEVHKVFGNGYEITVKDKSVYVSGNCNIYVDGDAYLQIKGNKTERIGGDYDVHVKGNYIVTTEKQVMMTSAGDTNIIAGGALGGGLKVSTGDYTYFASDVSIDGEIVAGKITSMGRIDGEGVSAGLQGFVSMLGGLSIGIPAAVPLQINCAGPITSFTSIDAPLGLFGVSSSILGFDVLNTLIFDTHIHPAPLGVTGPSTTQFIAV